MDIQSVQRFETYLRRFVTAGIVVTTCAVAALPLHAQACHPRETEKIPAPRHAPLEFGRAVAFSSDLVLVGAPVNDLDEKARAFVYRRTDDGFALEAELEPTVREARDYLGYAVALDGDLAVLGAPGHYNGSDLTGSAYVFRFDGSEWMEESRLLASDGEPDDEFGTSVAVYDDTILIGAADEELRSGAAYVYRYDGVQWNEEAKLVAPTRQAISYFGLSVALQNDTALIGSYYWDGEHSGAGAAYVFQFDGTHWVHSNMLTASDAESGDHFGFGLSLDEDAAIIGAFGDDDAGYNAGAAYLFRRHGSEWVEEAKLYHPRDGRHAGFGTIVDIDDDTAVIGSWYDSQKAFRAGMAYTYEFDGVQWNHGAALAAYDPQTIDYFGRAVAIVDREVIVGAPGADAAWYFNLECSCLDLTVYNPTADEYASIVVSRGTPGAKVATVISTEIGTTDVRDMGGYCATLGIEIGRSDIISPRHASFDEDGICTFNFHVPWYVQRRNFFLQSAQKGTCPEECVSDLIGVYVGP